ncbi:capsular polysaccharide export protein, LipB/KpsS family [Microbulbifer celer]|uniref:Capsule polysaccharide biosynthesis protein n=1 Tax=Microbulbifer celer TaxID=435905 RepID=A0ABW3UBF2_9GAMM|nr:hypothetical protein [Microbulbifer celer]UFN58978.1 hypothetical protein LPW13_08050 [Microbulbifer celer]
MRILIYEAMPDIVRADVIIRIARDYEAQGHTVFLLLDENVHLLKRNEIVQPHIVNCLNVIRSKLPKTGIPFFATPINRPLSKKFLESPSDKILEEIAAYKSNFHEKALKNFQPDTIIIWNGLMDYQRNFIGLAKNVNPRQKFSFLESGWFPQKNTYYSDPEGVNAASSLSRVSPPPLTPEQTAKIKKWKEQYRDSYGAPKICDKGYYFIPLQLETDTNITLFSPFKSMEELLLWVLENTDSERTIIVRPHPLSDCDHKEFSKLSDRIQVDGKTPLQSLLAESHAVIGINSTVLLESLIFEKPTIALGQGVFQHSKAIYLQPQDTPIPRKLDSTFSPIEKQEAFLYYLKERQRPIPTAGVSINRTLQTTGIETTKYSELEQVVSSVKIRARQYLNLLSSCLPWRGVTTSLSKRE